MIPPSRHSPHGDAGRGLTTVLILVVAIGPLSTDLYLPSLPDMQDHFATDAGAIQLTLSVYLVAFALSQLIYGPLSDRFGRRLPLVIGLGIYLAASVLCLLAPNMETLLAGRLLQGFGGCSGAVLARAVVRDICGPDRAGRMMASIAAAMALAPLLGPVIGGVLTDLLGWQSCFAALSLAGALALAGVLLLLPETAPSRTGGPAPAGGLRGMAGDFATLMRHRLFLGYTLAGCASYSGLFAFISGSAFVFVDMLGLSPRAYGFCFSAVVLGFILGARTSGRLQRDDRACVALGALLNLIGGLCMVGVLAGGWFTPAGILVPMILFMIGMGLLLPRAGAGAVAPFPAQAGTASSLVGALQYAGAALVGVAVGQFHNGGPWPMALAIAGSGLVALMAWLLLLRGSGQRNPNQQAPV